MPKQTKSQRAKLRSIAAKKKGSLRRKTPPHPSPAATRPCTYMAVVWPHDGWPSHILVYNRRDMERRTYVEVKPEPDPNPWPRLFAWLRRMVGK